MIINDLDVVNTIIPPREADAELRIDADAIEARAVSSQCLETVSGWCSQVVELRCRVQLLQLAHSNLLQCEGPLRRARALLEQLTYVAVTIAPDQLRTVSAGPINVKRY